MSQKGRFSKRKGLQSHKAYFDFTWERKWNGQHGAVDEDGELPEKIFYNFKPLTSAKANSYLEGIDFGVLEMAL